MGEGQCWFVYANGSRCVEPALPGTFFCNRHRDVRMHEVSRIWRAPEAEMPRELVAALRRAAPNLDFPASAPEPSGEGIAGAPKAGSPTAATPSAPGPSRSDLPPGEETPGSPLDWLLTTLQAAMEGVMAGDATPLQKANAVARLAGQYLKAYGVKELEREKKELSRRLAAAEAQIAALEERLAAQASGLPVSEGAVSPDEFPAEETVPEASPRSMGTPGDLWVTLGVEVNSSQSGYRQDAAGPDHGPLALATLADPVSTGNEPP